MGSVFSTQITCSDVLINRCFDCIATRCEYASELKHNLESLNGSIKELEGLKNDVMTKIDIAERQGRKRLDHVQRWLSMVDIHVEKTTKLNENWHLEKEKSGIGGCCCTNCAFSFNFGRKVVRRMAEVKALIIEVNEFKEVTQVTLPEAKVEIPCGPTVGLEQKLDTICSYLLKEEEHVNIVGLYGESGVGKTALLTQVNNMICSETSRFDLVIWVVVTKASSSESIQNDIGTKIGFYGEKWMSKSVFDKAVDILDVLNKKKFVLLLDNISEYIDLFEIGVPLRNRKQSKVVFTTPSERICANMEAHRKVKMEPLGRKDSWRLFCQKIGEDTLNSNSEIHCLAKELVWKCGGRPPDIIRWAQKMACNRTTQDWTNAVQHLKSHMLDSQVRNEEMTENPVRIEVDDDPSVYSSPICDLTALRGTPIDKAGIAQLATAREYVNRLKEQYLGAVFGLFRLPYILVAVRTMSLRLHYLTNAPEQR